MRPTPTIVALVAALAAFGCLEEMEAISQVTKFRVLGVQAEPPEIRPGQGTELRVLYADPKGEGRDVSILWLTCVGVFSPTADISEGCEPIWMHSSPGPPPGATPTRSPSRRRTSSRSSPRTRRSCR